MFIQFIILILFSLALIYFQSKYFFLIDQPTKQKHKLDYNKNTPLSGGIYFFLAFSINLILEKNYNQNFLIIFFLALFLILGIYSDLKINFTPKIRLLFQSIIILFLIIFLELKINRTGIFFLDPFISNYFFNIFFTLSCIIVLLNGSNFCDGVNVNLVGYYLFLILAILLSSLTIPNIYFDIEKMFLIILIFYIFNLFGKFFLGDNGVYVITIFMSIFIINLINYNNTISPLLALNLLWYPAFENLFSILRRYMHKTKVEIADRSHLHILIFEKLSSKFDIKFSNSLSGIILNIYMFVGFLISLKYYDDSKVLILIFLTNIILYMIVYFYLFLNRPKLK